MKPLTKESFLSEPETVDILGYAVRLKKLTLKQLGKVLKGKMDQNTTFGPESLAQLIHLSVVDEDGNLFYTTEEAADLPADFTMAAGNEICRINGMVVDQKEELKKTPSSGSSTDSQETSAGEASGS